MAPKPSSLSKAIKKIPAAASGNAELASTYKLQYLSKSELSFETNKIDRQEWTQVYERALQGISLKQIQMTKKNRELAVRVSRRAIEILEVHSSADRRTDSTCSNTSRRQVLFRHNLASIVCFSETKSNNQLGYIRQVKSRVFEMVNFVTSTSTGKRRVIELLRRLDQQKRHFNKFFDDKENAAKHISNKQSDSDGDEVDVIKVLPPISQREHPVFDIAEDDEMKPS